MNLHTVSVTKAYPLDSSEPVGFDEATGLPLYDRAYNASDLRRVMALMLTDGVFPDYGDELLVSASDGQWTVGTGVFVANGLVVPVEQRQVVISDFALATGQYAFVIAAGRFDSNTRDGAIYVVVEETPSHAPTRNESVWELVLGRIDWRGELRDLRLDPSVCGVVAPVLPVDTDSFMAELKTAVSQFNLNVGEVQALPSGTTPTVTVRKPVQAGGEVYIDFGIPRGAPGEPGEDGDRAPTVYVRPESDAPKAEDGVIWLVDDVSKSPHEIVGIRVYESPGIFPEDSLFPAADLYPGGLWAWVDHVISASLVSGAVSGDGHANLVTFGTGAPAADGERGDGYIDMDTGDVYVFD